MTGLCRPAVERLCRLAVERLFRLTVEQLSRFEPKMPPGHARPQPLRGPPPPLPAAPGSASPFPRPVGSGGPLSSTTRPDSITRTRSKSRVSPTSWVMQRSAAPPRQAPSGAVQQRAATLAVEPAEGLVKDDQPRPRAEQPPPEPDSLPLAAGEEAASLAQDRLQPVGVCPRTS